MDHWPNFQGKWKNETTTSYDAFFQAKSPSEMHNVIPETIPKSLVMLTNPTICMIK